MPSKSHAGGLFRSITCLPDIVESNGRYHLMDWEDWLDEWEKECQEEEKEWDAMFRTGIYYANMVRLLYSECNKQRQLTSPPQVPGNAYQHIIRHFSFHRASVR